MISIWFKRVLFISLIALLACSFGCTKSGGGGDDEEVDQRDSESLIPSGLFSQCGAVIDGALKNPIVLENAVRVNVEPVSTELAVVSLLSDHDNVGNAGDRILVKFQALTSAGASASGQGKGMEFIQQNARGAFFVPAGEECRTTVEGGGSAMVGQLFSTATDEQGNQLSFNEQLLFAGAAKADGSDPCGGGLLAQCYGNIKQVKPESGEDIRDFLWKPSSERDGNLVILVDLCDVIAHVEGAISETKGPGYPTNGRCSTIRFSNSGASFGENVRVSFSDAEGKLVRIFGEEEIIIPDGGSRVEREE